VDLLLGLEEVLLACERLGDDGPDASKAGGGDEVVVGMGGGEVGGVGDDVGGLADGVDVAQ
jgi:hypothetical protein